MVILVEKIQQKELKHSFYGVLVIVLKKLVDEN